jgi:hypothetical protein
MSDEEDAAGALANKPEVEWLFGRLGNTLRLKPDKVLKMKQDETSMCVMRTHSRHVPCPPPHGLRFQRGGGGGGRLR